MLRVKQDIVASIGEFVGTTLFLFLAYGGAKTAQFTRTSSQTEGLETALGNQTIIFIAVSFGLSLLVNAWVFYRITGGLFNPAVTLALYLIGGLTAVRAVLLTISQILGGIAAAGLIAALTPFGGAESVRTTLAEGVNIGQGLFIEAFLTAILVITILFLAAEKHKSTFLAPIGIGLSLMVCHMFGVVWTGCGMNPARAFGPSVISADFPGYHWIYWLGPLIGTLMSVGFYLFLKSLDYSSVVFGQDATSDEEARKAQAIMDAAEKMEQGKAQGGGGFRQRSRARFHIIFHPSSRTKADANTNEAIVPEVFDPENPQQTTALQTGEASLVDLQPVGISSPNPTEATMVQSNDSNDKGMPPHGYPSVQPFAQNNGGLAAPGTDGTGLSRIPYTAKILGMPEKK